MRGPSYGAGKPVEIIEQPVYILPTPASSGGATNLSASYAATTVTVNSDTGTDATINAAGANAGVMSAADKAKLDGITPAISVTATCDFGALFTDKAKTVVTGQTWVTAGSEIVASVRTPASVDPDEMYLLDIKPVISDLVAGVGFTVTLYSQPEAKGSYDVMCIGI